ncbi:hypothetical protein BDY17DRAFT_323023 [Neohortaea acidophila]|uniref:Extensin domain-containing protein n=1 Tax=Neohortaea acidophila TaxID=245834 RepID=A0A6A6PVU3_9PEZI|nr:uncharacterized protein BDY17DRAFT_323023 [Neohortaea acidophila]KAF2484152.1 hypothetical protein BDY17DRAFT_323023 [Neohortaea acidophila]
MPTTANMGPALSEDCLAEVEEPPEQVASQILSQFRWSPPNIRSEYTKATPHTTQRRESLLTRQLHSETEHTEDDEPRSPVRALSKQTTWSSFSMPSTAELTSDDGHSIPSTAGSPPLPPSHTRHVLPIPEEPLEQDVQIVGQINVAPIPDKTEQKVEANLGRKRCISFACRGKEESKPVQPPPEPVKMPEPASPPKRKCTLKFVCPLRGEATNKAADNPPTKRSPSPAPKESKPSSDLRHRGSDSTIVHASPRSPRKTVAEASKEDTPQPIAIRSRRFSNDESGEEDKGDESTRFHAFATSEEEPENWTQLSTCYRTRLTVDDTLKKENVIRKTCEEVEEEVLEEEEEEEEEELQEELANVEDDDGTGVADEDYDTDEGFHSDDEGGFASSDSDSGDESDFEWWKPGGSSTAATSMDQLDRLAIITAQPAAVGTSIGSGSDSPTSPRSPRPMMRKTPSRASAQTPAVTIKRSASPNLPDTSDFVCGTLDEDRSLEEEFINRRKQKQAAKLPFRPQDIDPSFPTSDPEMDEEDDDSDDEPPQTEDAEDMMHGKLDEIHGAGTVRRRSPVRRSRTRSNSARSPPPRAVRHPSPAPLKRRPTLQSPPPPAPRRSIARSPAPPRKLFGRSPNRAKSPARMNRMTSPPNSPTTRSTQRPRAAPGLASRPQPTHTSSLPRRPFAIGKGKLATIIDNENESDEGTSTPDSTAIPKRGAIDIVKGLEKKRAWRKKKLAQKMCAKNATKGEKPYKVKPGTGAERMREVGLQLQEYHGKAEHILSL